MSGSSFRLLVAFVVVVSLSGVAAGTSRSGTSLAPEQASVAAAPSGVFALDPSATRVSNPNGTNLTNLDAAAGTAHVEQLPVVWDETWKLPQTITLGKPSSVTLGLNVTNNGPKPGPGQYNVGISVTAPNLSEQLLLDISSRLSGQQTYTWTVPEGSVTDLVLVIHPYESASVTYHYKPSAGSTTGTSTRCVQAAKSPGCVLARIEDSPCYKQFYGSGDPAMTTLEWGEERIAMGLAVAHSALEYPDVTIEADIPGEESGGVHSPALLYPGNDLFNLLSRNEPPRDLFATNIYARATPRLEAPLLQKILASGGDLKPADVLKLALDAVKEKDGVASYPLAVLVANNLLKNAAEIGREAVAEADNAYAGVSGLSNPSNAVIKRHNEKVKALTATLCRWSALVGKLASLRADPAGSKDKIGPWYHAFTILTAGALIDGNAAKVVVLAEHTGKGIKLFGSEGGFNREKFLLDSEWAATANHIDKGGLHRPKSG